LRPLLLMATKRYADDVPQTSSSANLSSLDNDLIKRSCTLCIDTAHRLIETLYQHLDTMYRSSGWHSVYCRLSLLSDPQNSNLSLTFSVAFASATILLASLKLPRVDEKSGTAFEVSWTRCLSIMKHYEEQIHTAPYAVRVLETLRYGIQESQNRGQSESSPYSHVSS